jgi:hypothetical protein
MSRINKSPHSGISLVEFMIILSSVVILLSSVDSWFFNYAARGRVAEALLVAETAKSDIIITCNADPGISELTQHDIGHAFPYSSYVDSISISGSCEYPQIVLITRDTGLAADPMLTIVGDLAGSLVTWTCRSSGPNMAMPSRCRRG